MTLDTNDISIADCLVGGITGMEFNDINGDGIQQPGDPVLPGVTVFLETNNNGVLDPGETSTVTDINGNYAFTNLSGPIEKTAIGPPLIGFMDTFHYKFHLKI